MFEVPITISDAIERIEKNRLLLPAIQREFIWEHEKIEWLFDSIMCNYPIGSFLFWRVEGDTKNKFKFYRCLQNFREYFKTHNEEINTSGLPDFEAILDGQQRLTALYIGLKGSFGWKRQRVWYVDSEYNIPTRKLYLNILLPLNDEELNEKYEFRFLTDTQYLEDGGSKKWFQVGKILDLKNNFEFHKFLEANEYKTNEFTFETLSILQNAIHTERIINFYLEKKQDIDRSLDIFIRINSGGEPLAFSDLLMSIAIANWKTLDARKEINNLVDEIRYNDFFVNRDFILKVFLVLHSNDVRFKVKNFSSENAQKFEERWEHIRKSIMSVIYLIKSYGLTESTLISKNAIIPIIYWVYHKNYYEDFHEKICYKQDREIIKKWLYIVLLNQTFGRSADSVLTNVRVVIKERLDTFSEFPINDILARLKTTSDLSTNDEFIENLLITQKNNPYAFLILSLLYPNLDYRNNDFHKDHIHPYSFFDRNYLIQQGITDEDRISFYLDSYNNNGILNLQMLDKNENMSKQDKSLKEWVNEQNIDLQKHFIPPILEFNEFERFIEQRRQILKKKLSELMQ